MIVVTRRRRIVCGDRVDTAIHANTGGRLDGHFMGFLVRFEFKIYADYLAVSIFHGPKIRSRRLHAAAIRFEFGLFYQSA